MDKKYTEDLIKGKITEVIFEEMFRVSEEFTIIPLGYEHTTPILAQYQRHLEIQQVLENIRNAPDFALISEDKKRVFLVEVKYRNTFTTSEILEIARDISARFNPCFLFLVSKDNFYFSPCSSIINKNGKIESLRESWIKREIQINYLNLLKEFIKQ
ncbi:MAG TPA: hypothetical protein VNW29_00205 [Candidatus Sulfotelmatobacter sp.]|jgi:hypothetical protein|nr:hypothetical protein [Candidatus Sulfotelmatobacter sp.]